MRTITLGATAAFLIGVTADLRAQAATPTLFSARVREWTVPWPDSRPRDPMADDQGRVWFVGQVGNYVAHLQPATGKFTQFTIDEGTHPHTVIVDRQGRAWYAGNGNAMIGRIDPGSTQVTRYRMEDPRLADPHTMAFDRRGNLWFTAQNGNAVGRMEVANGRVRTVKVPTANARPYGLVIDSLTDRPWFVQFGTNRIGSIDPNTLELREYVLPDAGSRPRRLAFVNGRVWAGDYTRGALLELDPASGKVNTFPLPGGLQSLPYAMTSDDRGRIWVAETGIQPNRIVAVESGTGRVVGEAIIAESGGGTIRHMTFDARTRFIWFGTDKNTVGRVEIP
jgi:virginiamycin B lyase